MSTNTITLGNEDASIIIYVHEYTGNIGYYGLPEDFVGFTRDDAIRLMTFLAKHFDISPHLLGKL